MQISCEKCGTTYALDDRLIPPGGAPVQCTRCGHVFTAMLAPASATGPSRSMTQVFGSQGAGPGSAAASLTPQPQGPRPGTPAPSASRSTQIFAGVVPPVAPVGTAAPHVSPPVRSATQQFGSQTPAPRLPTQQFGTQTPVPRAPTQQFGAQTAVPRSATQQFGAPGTPAAPRPATQMFASSPLLSPTGGSPPVNTAPRAGTQVFGAAVVPTSPRVEAQPPRASTQMFASSPLNVAPTIKLSAAETQAAVAGKQAAAVITAAESSVLEKLWDEPSAQASASADPYADDLPLDDDAAAPYRPAPIALPPEGPQSLMSAGSFADGEDAPERLLGDQIRRRNRTALAVVALLVLAVAGFLGYRLVIAHRSAVSAELLGQADAAFALIRRDDRASQVKVVEELHRLALAHPQFVEARADAVVALVLELDDSRISLHRAELESEVLNRQVARLRDEHTPSDWENRVNGMIDRLQAIKKETDPRIEEAAALDQQVSEAYRALVASGGDLNAREEQALVRAQAIYFGVKGSDQALTLTERYKALKPQDGWAAIALAEYALNARVSPETTQDALKGLESMITADSAFLRPYVLAARLSAREKRYEPAVSSLEAVVALNPSHEVARKLLTWTLDEQRNAAAPPPPPPGPP